MSIPAKAVGENPAREFHMSTTKAPVTKAVQSKGVKVEVEVAATKKATAAELLQNVLTLIDRQAVVDPEAADIKFGKAVGLVGGGAVYVNRSNADVRMTTGQVAALVKTIKGATVRGPQNNYLRIPLK